MWWNIILNVFLMSFAQIDSTAEYAKSPNHGIPKQDQGLTLSFKNWQKPLANSNSLKDEVSPKKY